MERYHPTTLLTEKRIVQLLRVGHYGLAFCLLNREGQDQPYLVSFLTKTK